MAARKYIPPEVQTRVLISSARRCCICYGINRDFTEKKGQIAHIDQNPSNPEIDNLTWLCFDHHDAYDGKTRQSKNLTNGEVKHYRDLLYRTVEKWRKDGIEPNQNELQELKFDAGTRVKQVREEINLKTSQFAELFSIPSQRDYERMENGEIEVPFVLLEKISEITGVSFEWLKHGDQHIQTRYVVEEGILQPLDEALSFIARLKPKEIIITLETTQLISLFVFKTGDYRYEVIDYGLPLDFWNWVESHWAIKAFYNLLRTLGDEWIPLTGVVLETKYQKQLYDGNIHFLAAARHSTKVGRDLPYALIDIDRTREGVIPYQKRYGNWIIKVHDEFRKNLEIKRPNQTINFSKDQISQKTVVFQLPTQLPPLDRSIVWTFPYTVVESKLIGQPEEVSRTSFNEIKVSATFELVSIWGLFYSITNTSDQEEIKRKRDGYDLMKILFWYGKGYITEKLESGNLQQHERLSLNTTSPETRDRFDPSRIPEPNEFKFVV